MKSYTFHTKGMHCKSCEILTEGELREHPSITHVKSSSIDNTIDVTGDFGERSPESIATELSPMIEKHGYALSHAPHQSNNLKEFRIALPIAIGFGVLFFVLQKMGLVNLIGGSGEDLSLTTVMIIGVVASLSSCMAVVGGLVLSMSATFAKSGSKIKPQIFFHISRLVSFFILGGVIGTIGSAFTLGRSGNLILGLLVALVMLVMGVNLLGIFKFTKRLQPLMPKFISSHAKALTSMNHSLTPLLLGAITFFLPCGFTQAMQVYTLSTGSFLSGALTMLVFALGTLPVLALLSFGSSFIKDRKASGVFYKSAGLVVIMFAIINLLGALAVAGVIKPILNF
jgi:sulfite exporter TauE/SafE/copper chaperone CopZ